MSIPATIDHLLTVEDYLALGVPPSGYTELQVGRLLMSPSPVPDHQHAGRMLANQLDGQVPEQFEVITDVDVDLELAPPDEPGTVRRPDLIIVNRTARQRIRGHGGITRAAEVAVIVEILPPGSERTVRKTKHSEYANAGVPHYWIISLDEPVSVAAYHLTDELGYIDGNDVTGVFDTAEPFPLRVDLERLI
ncbi:hypothetical protein GCM10012275_50980 [Longimycelium tulufanense]|uniref:Putative restriction endonuclease domain-containing protein n=1 Tax=Longimycelium tulufanense TaxID=907463 RepID=A0A8J3FYR1_9PSEU|nr:Uma2 family endonuclease [Longimycelium tulufanense]GGM74055.1 hypothetical protein GCM10012275_50980 [Longimycelium tulufanense]